MNFNALNQDSDLPAQLQDEAIRKVFAQAAPIVITTTDDAAIPPELRGESLTELIHTCGRTDHLIGIRLGPEFGNLAVVASRSAEQVSAFRQANPALQKGLVTRWNGWYLVWLKTETRANNLAADDWLWLRQGIIPLNGLLGEQDDSQIAADSELPEIPFAEISWPGVLVEGFRVQRLKKEHGPPFRQNGRRRTLNEFFLVYWLTDPLTPTYNPKLEVFTP